MDVENANCKLKLSEHTDLEILPIERPLKIDREITGLEKLVEELRYIFTFDHVNVHDVQKLMAGYKSEPKEWRKYAKFDRFRYTRNLVDVGNGAFNIMIICWGPGHASAIHDHADSHCFMKMLSGNLDEVRYDWPERSQPDIVKKLRNSQSESHCNTENVSEIDGEKTNYSNGNVTQNGGANDSCQSDSRQNGNDAEYNGESIKEIRRTRLEVNDVCYINDALGLHRMENPSHVDSAVSLHLYSPPFDSCRVFDSRTGKPTEVKVTFWSMYGKKIKRVIEANPIADSQ